MADFFSKREGFTLPQGEQVDDLNERTRNRLAHLLEAVYRRHNTYTTWLEIADIFFDVIGELPTHLQRDNDELQAADSTYSYLMQEYIAKSKWYIVFDLLEIIHGWLRLRSRENSRPYEQLINDLFSEEIVRWRMVDGRFERIIEQVEVIKKAERSLEDGEFAKAHEHYLKAWQAFHKRPDPDLAGCMRDAWDAVEIVALHCAGMKGGTFQNALGTLISSGIVLDDWKKTLEKFYGLACDWVRHPKPGPLPCKMEDAEMFLVIASQMIIYMIGRYKQVKK